jgi:hypothetical protein
MVVLGALGGGLRAPLLAQVEQGDDRRQVLLVPTSPASFEGVGPGQPLGMDLPIEGVRYTPVPPRSGATLGALLDAGELPEPVALELLGAVARALPQGASVDADQVWVFGDGRVQLLGAQRAVPGAHPLADLCEALLTDEERIDALEGLSLPDLVLALGFAGSRRSVPDEVEVPGVAGEGTARNFLRDAPSVALSDRLRGLEVLAPVAGDSVAPSAAPPKVAVARAAVITLVLGMGTGWALAGSSAASMAQFEVPGASHLELICGASGTTVDGDVLRVLPGDARCEFTATLAGGTVARGAVLPLGGRHHCSARKETLQCSAP